jgi:hypothetical protein
MSRGPDLRPMGPAAAAGERGERRVSQRAQQHGRMILITGRGAVVVMLAMFTLGLFGASWLSQPAVAGAAFVAGNVTAAWYTRPRDLLTVAVTPPLLFCVALIGVKALTSTGDTAVAIAGGTAITLAVTAPWLLAGTAVSLIIACLRGLPRCVGELRRQLQPGRSRPGAGPRAGMASRPGDGAGDLPGTRRGQR